VREYLGGGGGGGCPAKEQMPFGVESQDITDVGEDTSDTVSLQSSGRTSDTLSALNSS